MFNSIKRNITMLINLKFFTLLYVAVIGLGLSGCETMEGAGRDIQNVGQSVEDAAE